MKDYERISLTIKPALLARIDAVAAARDESRSEVVDRMLTEEIEAEEGFIEAMGNPTMRGLTLRLARSPRLLKVLAKVVGDEVTEEELARAARRAPKLKAMGEEVQRRRRGKRASGTLEGEGA